MKRKLLFGSAVVPALLATGAMGQVVSFMDVNQGEPITPAPNFNVGDYYNELFAGQGAYWDPGNNIWNGFVDGFAYGSTDVYGGAWPQQPGNTGNPYAAFNLGAGWVTSDGPDLFTFSGSATNSGDADSSGLWNQVTLEVGDYSADTAINPNQVPNGAPVFLFSSAADFVAAGTNSHAVFILQNVPPGAYGLYLYGAAPANNRGTTFSVNSGSAHNGISSTLNAGVSGKPPQTFVEGENFVIWENVTPDVSSNITIMASPNSADGVGNSNLTGHADVNGIQLIFHPPPTAQGMTSAQNVFAGGAASFSFTPVFAAGAAFQWQSVIGGVTNNLSNGGDISGATTTNLTIANAASHVGSYQCVLTLSGTATNTGPAAPLTVLTSLATSTLQSGEPASASGNILQPGDLITDENNTNLIRGEVYDSVPPPFNMSYTNVEDNTLLQYVNLGMNGDSGSFQGPVGIVVTPRNGTTIVTGMRLFTANSHPEDDPADYLLEGSLDGSNFTTIAGGLLAIPAARNAAGGPINITNQVLQEIDFANTTAYTTYQLTFTNLNSDAATNGMQLAEIQLLGSFPPIAPGIAQQPFASELLLAGRTLNATVVASGAGPLTYKWYYNTTTQIPNATNATLTLAGVQATNDGSYNCVISNPYGSTNSTLLVLTVVTPTPYEAAVQADGALCYYPLDETSGSLAYEYLNGNVGTYQTNAVLGQPGVPDPPFLGFPTTDYAVDINNTLVDSWVSAPFGTLEGSNNLTIPNLTLSCWIYPVGDQTPGQGLIFDRGGASGGLDTGDSYFTNSLSYEWNNNSSDTYGYNSGLIVPQNEWSLVAVTIAPNQAILYLLNPEGRLTATNNIPQFEGPLDGAWRIGNDALNPLDTFNGMMNAVAVFPSTLSFAQMNALYDVGAYGTTNAPPVVIVPSTPIPLDQGANGSIISTIIDGPAPFTYQWYYIAGVVTNQISGATNSTLTLTNIQTSQGNYNYFVVASNAYGAGASSFATLNVSSGMPVISPDLEPTNIAVVGATYVLSVGETGTVPFTNVWTYNGLPLADGGSISGATTTTLTIANVQLTNAGTYQFLTTNVDGNASSVVETLFVITPSAYETAVLADQPLAYYPLNETNGDTAYDIINGYDGAYANPPTMVVPGPSSSVPAGAVFDGVTQSVLIPDTPALDFAGPITLEAWVQPTATQASGPYGSIISKGYDASQHNAEMYILVVNSTSFNGGYYNEDVGGYGPTGGVVTTNWTHVALTWDGTNWNLYEDGVVVGTNPGPIGQLYFADPWGIGAGTVTGSGRIYEGNISAAAIYNHALTPSQVTMHYNIGAFGTTNLLPTVSAAPGTAGSVIISWPDSFSSLFVLQQSAAVNGPWTNVTATPQITNGQNQVTLAPALAPGTSATFFRLFMQ